MELTPQEKWEKCRRLFRDNLSQEQFDHWFAQIMFASFINGELHIAVPSPFFKEQLETNYLGLLRKVLRHVYGDGVKLFYHYQVVKGLQDTNVAESSAKPSAAVGNRSNAANPFIAKNEDEIDSQLNPRYNFENYCSGDCNLLAETIGKAIAKNPSQQTYNPFFVFGPPGVGKTHLAQAIGIGIKETSPRSRVLYITARLFESQYTAANARGKINEFIAFYQNIDTLIIDDIQDFIGKPGTQRTFFQIFNHLHLNAKQLIMTSDVRPSEMDNMEERLLSRFKWGMTCELFRPDYDMRVKVLRHKAQLEGIDLPEDVIEYIAENVTKSFRELEGVMVSIVAHAVMGGRSLDLGLAKEVVANSVKIRRHTVNFEMIAEQVCSYYNMSTDLLFTPTRKREVNDVRQLVMYMTKKHTTLPLTGIGTRLNRTHATVLHAVNNIENRLAIEPQLRADLAAIEQSLSPVG
ncbi:MAG: chromosomal replication initiator protein DnaA [Bacteroides sp.]|nr:chromosomal replication initiator protein DnaA [Bacteroides sp.]MCM1378713.1 chromosomal replication initiator protein DnaA [Bacteroides sp.]MCM1444986.1 chromosomal replication initiator protein DnaA [Prevotella sp.]